MSLLLIEGFEGWDQTQLLKFIDINEAYGTAGFTFSTGRDDRGKCLQHAYTSGGNFHIGIPGVVDDTYVFGMAFRTETLNNQQLVRFEGDSGGYIWEIYIGGTANLVFKCNTVQYGVQGVSLGDWNYIEIKCKAHDSTGLFEVKFNGSQIVNETGIDSLPSGDTKPTHLFFYWNTWSQGYIDDMYLLDTNGTRNNDFLGDCRVDMVSPNGAGNYTQLTPSAGNNFECVDEAITNETDYVEGLTDGNKDTYTFADVPTELDDADIIGVMLRSVAVRTSAYDNIKLRSICRAGAADYYDGTGEAMGDSYKVINYPIDEDPSDSGAWTKAKINACEFGIELEKT